MDRDIFPLTGSKAFSLSPAPDALTVERDPTYLFDAGEGSVLPEDFSGCSVHGLILIAWQWSGE
jgi:hypothetical protein